MAKMYFKDDRNLEFLNSCKSTQKELGQYHSVSDVVSRAVLKPASSFYLHPREYSKILHGGGECLPRNPIKRELHIEILRRGNDIRARHPHLKIHEIAKIIERQPAPRFYISEKRAACLYYESMRRK